MRKLSLVEKLFCECMSLLLIGWCLFLMYLLYLLRDYLLSGVFVAVGIAAGIAVLELWRDEAIDSEANNPS